MKNLEIDHLKFNENRQDMKLQWTNFWPVFDHFHLFLKNKGLKPKTIGEKTNCAIVFIMNYLRLKDNIKSINEISGEEIKKFMLYNYHSLFPDSTVFQKKTFKKAIIDFYTFLNKKGFLSKEQLKEIVKGDA